ncbi:MAG: sugar phosphate isomerase/epimerase [Kiritimatiellae bacterium]|nr:sugar phosphate isomerase/epimerase [Kiritimatiellia bacterium]
MDIAIQSDQDVETIVRLCRETGVKHALWSLRGRVEVRGEPMPDEAELARGRDAFRNAGIRLAALIPPAPSREAVLGENESETHACAGFLRELGRLNVPMALCYPFDRFLNYKVRYAPDQPPLEVMPGQPRWPAVLEFFERMAAAAREAGVRLANHVFATPVMKGILDAVANPALGVVYCTGAYIFGHDPYAGIRLYGADRIFLAHARNLARRGPGRAGHVETPLPDGDLDMPRYVRALREAGYDGLLIPEHAGEAGLAESVSYLRTLLARTARAARTGGRSRP